MLARAVDALERLFMLQADKAMMAGESFIFSIVSRFSSMARFEFVKIGAKLVLRRRNLVVLGLRGNAELPQLVVDFLHELVHRRADGAEVVLFKLLALARRIARTACGRS